MESKIYAGIGETLYSEKLENGLSVFVLPKKGYSKSFAVFATDYGGADRRFKYGGEWINTPAGVAHYLEHKMFDMEGGNALNILAANGASPNAWTSSAMTAYHFECASGFEENLRTLLSFVSVPYFTDESVEKERGIISQEIHMGDDTPGNIVYYNLMKALYAENPVRDEVAGTVESIAEITSETLYACHKIFYNPSNMVLCVAGNADPQRVIDIAREVLPAEPGEVPQRDYGKAESQKVYSPVTRVEMEVSAPQFLFGCRLDPAPRGAERARERVLGDVALEYLMGKPSPLYTRLYAEGLIKSDFGAALDYAAGSAVILAGGESRDPEAVLDALKAQIAQIAANGIDEKLFTRIKNSVYGDKIRSLGSFSGVCTEQAESFFAGFNLPDTFEVLASLTQDELKGFILQHFQPDSFALSVIDPIQK